VLYPLKLAHQKIEYNGSEILLYTWIE
jgi:hypothetical protein